MEKDAHFSILIADDEMSELDALNNILKSSYTIYFAKTGASAIKRANTNKPDLILLDIIMPDMNGFEVLSELKKSDATRDIPVIFITGLNAVKDEEKGFHLGAVDYITKPFHASIVRARIEAHLKIVTQIRTKDSASFTVKTKRGVRSILFRSIMYVEVSGHWLHFHLIGGERVTIYSTLKEYEGILGKEARFKRCHNSFVVNMDFVEAVEVKDVLMKNGIHLPISKKYADFKSRYVEWVSV